jgi:tRNA (guanine-N7-)-methyltransferase
MESIRLADTSAAAPIARRHSGMTEMSGTARAPRALFGRRKGRPLRPHQAGLIETLLPRLALDLGIPSPDEPADLFPHAPQTVRLEIGFGGAEHMVAEASRDPSVGFIGVEPFINGMAKALAAVEAHRLTNIRLHLGDAAKLLEWLPSGKLARVDLLYPDPWPKRRHWKRRFIQDRNVAEIARVLCPGSDLRFATDCPDYAAWTLEHLIRSPGFTWMAEHPDDWRRPWPGYCGTRYEAKAKREGRVSCYLTFRRTIEPTAIPGDE